MLQSCHPANLVFNPKTGGCTWSWDSAVKHLCSSVTTEAPNNLKESGLVFPGQFNRDPRERTEGPNNLRGPGFVFPGKFNRDPREKDRIDDLCPSDFSGLAPYPYDCKKFVNCWKGNGN